MKEGQNDTYYPTAESIAPFCETLRKKELEVLYMVDPIDGYAGQQLKEFGDSKSGDKQISSKGHVDRMEDGQNDIYYITGESFAVGEKANAPN